MHKKIFGLAMVEVFLALVGSEIQKEESKEKWIAEPNN